MEATGTNGRISISGESVIISRKGTGLLTAINQGLQGDKTIPIRHITALQFKEPGTFTVGYLRLSIQGRDPVGGALEAARDENAILFEKSQKLQIVAIRDALQEKINAGPTIGGTSSAADEIEKFASLRDRGLLTEEEFQAKKRQLLGL